MPKHSGFLFGNSCMLIATLFWGVNVAVTKALIPAWMTAPGISLTRLVGGCLLFWLASLFFKCAKIEKADWLKIFLGGAIGLFAFIWLFVLSLRYGSAIDISIIMTLPPVFVILIGVIFEKQRPGWLEYAGIAVSFIGASIVIIAGANDPARAVNSLYGNGLAILSTICYAFYLVILAKPSKKYSPLSLLRWVFLFAAIPSLFLVPKIGGMPILHTDKLTPWLEISFILFCPTFIAYFLVQPAIKNIGAELSSLYQYILPVFAAISAAMLGLESIRLNQIAAMLVIVGGMIMTNIGKKRRENPHKAVK